MHSSFNSRHISAVWIRYWRYTLQSQLNLIFFVHRLIFKKAIIESITINNTINSKTFIIVFVEFVCLMLQLVYFEPDEVDESVRSSKAKVDAFIKGSTQYGVTGNRDNRLQLHNSSIKGTLHFLKFQTSMMANFVRIVQTHDLTPQSRSILLHQSPSMQSHHHISLPPSAASATATNKFKSSFLESHTRMNSNSSNDSLHQPIDSLPSSSPQLSAIDSSSASTSLLHQSTPKHLQNLRSSSASVLAFSSAQSTKSNPSTDGNAATTVHLHAFDHHDNNSHSILHHHQSTFGHTNQTKSSHHSTTFIAHPNDEQSIPNMTNTAPQTSTVSCESQLSSHQQHQQNATTIQSLSAMSDFHHQYHNNNNNINVFTHMSDNPSSLVSSSSPSLISHQSEFCPSRLSSQSSHCDDVQQLQSQSQFDLQPFAERIRHSLESVNNKPSIDGQSQSTIATAKAPVSESPVLSSTHRSNSNHSRSGYSHSSSAASHSQSPHATSFGTAPSWLAAFPATCPPFCPPVCATGGGAYKFEELFKSQLGVELFITDELESLVRGIDFLIHQQPDSECYYLSQFRFRMPLVEANYGSVQYPYLVVNIGSGVSILKVCGPNSFERVGGTSLGGGTFYGLCRALCGCTSFEEALEMAEQGHSQHVDLLVGDIYGGDYAQLGLSADNIASSFGKLVRSDALQQANKHDLAKALLIMITNNIGSLANLYAHKVLHIPQIIFVGNFLTHNDIAKRGLAFATDYWSHQTAKALFLRHEGYFGAVGSMLFE